MYNYKDGDLEGLVNVPLSIEEVLVSIQITERKDKVKLSFRSKGNIPVNLWAKEFFNGGGHLNAAGGQMPLPLDCLDGTHHPLRTVQGSLHLLP